jgi:low temperature requirement protein LtrA
MSAPPPPEQPAPEKRVTWAELFFDLVFVFAVTQVSVLLHGDHSPAGIVRAVVVFIPVYWVWVGTTIQSNVNDLSRPLDRLPIFAVALGGLFMALAVADAYDGRALLFAGSYWACRLVLGIRLFVSPHFTLNPFVVSMAITGPMLVVGALLHGDARVAVWALAAVTDLSSPTVLRRRLQGMHYDPGHLSERFGTFVLIALGESIVAIGSPAAVSHHLDANTLLTVAAAFALTCGLWWVYFHFATDAMRHALATAKVQLDITRHVLSYGHVLFIASIMTIAVGMSEAVHHPSARLSWGVTALLYVGCAIYLSGFGYTRWMMFRKVSSTRLVAAGVLLALLPVGREIPAVAALALAALVLAVLNVVEYQIVARDQRAAALPPPTSSRADETDSV